jgi:peptidoglycan/xylan/chitin deacetylase (PgdA/CDA1 family)
MSWLERPDGLTAGMVRGLIERGWELGCHSLTHPDLTQLDAVRLEAEVDWARRSLRQWFGEPVEFYCYPSGPVLRRSGGGCPPRRLLRRAHDRARGCASG